MSAANDAGCQKCHGAPYLKHGYRVAAVHGLDDFAACKVCHYDTRNGGHQAWQLLVDDPAAYAAQNGAPTAAQNALYAYKASVMNDTHMSHAMEFAYPQSMANCVTCHEGKLGMILTDANFTLATCKSCHPVTGAAARTPSARPRSMTIMAATTVGELTHGQRCVMPRTCTTFTRGAPATAATTAAGAPRCSARSTPATTRRSTRTRPALKYSDAFKVAITDASYDTTTKMLTFTFTATESHRRRRARRDGHLADRARLACTATTRRTSSSARTSRTPTA